MNCFLNHLFQEICFTFRKALRPYVDYMQSVQNGFSSTTLDIGEGFEYSVFLG